MPNLLLRLSRSVALILVVAAAIGPAFAGVGGGTGPADVTDLKTMTASRATTPPGCIGRAVTPMCAVETAQACDNWGDLGLCRAVGHQPLFEPWSHEHDWHLYVFHYKAVGEHVLTRADIPAWAASLGDASWRQGDLAYDVWFQICRPSDACVATTPTGERTSVGEGCTADRCDWEVSPRTYILRKAKGGWRVVYVYIPQWHQRDEWTPSWRGAGATQ